MYRICVLVFLCVFFSACAVAPNSQHMEQIALMEQEQQALRDQIVGVQARISQLEEENKALAVENTELKRVMTILDMEKDSRVDESTELRIQVRKFTQRQIDNLRDFMVQSNLLDYVGEELVERTNIDEEAVVFVDFDNVIPRKGTLMGVVGFFARPTEFSVNVLRQVDDRFVVIWQSQSMSIADQGYQRLRFPVSVGVEQGDVLAYDFPISVGVNYDAGTGNSLLSKKSFALGESVDPSSLKAEDEKRAYSIGVIAILEE